MKILILSASIGSGHTRAAQALEQALRARGENDVEVIDFMSSNVSRFNQLLKRLYLSALKLIPDLYDRIYRLAGRRRAGPFTRLLWSTLMYLPFNRLIAERKPDVIVCTHPFPEAAAALWKFLHVKSAGRFLLAAVLTDYSLHEIWLYSEVDAYFVATAEMKSELELNSRQKIFATGIPISIRNEELGMRNEISIRNEELGMRNEISIRNEELGMRNEKPNSQFRIPNSAFLIMGGGLGLGSIEETLRELDAIEMPLSITVIAGRNEKLAARIRAMKSRHSIEVLGYVDNVIELMQRAMLLITKPGALTMTEAFAVGLPMILHAPIPGPEALNAKYAVEHGAACRLSNGENIAPIVEELLRDRSKLEAMSKSAFRLSRAAAADEIVERIINLANAKEV